MQEDEKIEALKSPLCVFTLSPPFTVQEFTRPSVRPASRRPATPYWRRSDYSLPRTRPRFKPSLRQASHALAKYLTGRVKNRRKESLTLQDVLNTIRRVWTSPNTLFKSSSSPNMEDRFRKKSSVASDIPSPVLLRRRLSAPETIMRKHMLAQQRSESQDSDVTQASDVRSCQWRMETGVGSDPNLSRKRDHGLMRKSTLMRRLWGSNKPLSERSSRLSSSYYDWQYGKLSQGRSTQSLGSTHSSPEHLKGRSRNSLNGDELKTSPIHKKYENVVRKTTLNPKISFGTQMGDTNRLYNNGFDKNETAKYRISVRNGNLDVQSTSFKSSCCSNYTFATSFENPTSSVDSRLSTTKTPTITTTETESEHYSTRSTSTTGTTTFSDNSDSAYTNSRSNFTHTSNENSSVCTTTCSSERFVEENGNVGENQNTNHYRNTKEYPSAEKKKCADPKTTSNSNTRVALDNVNDSSTQTTDTANLNVISNVQLSQSTLNLIYNQVMQDVQKSPSTAINISTVSASIPLQSSAKSAMPQPKLIKVQQVPSFYLKQKEEEPSNPEQHRILKYMVSNVGTGSPYSKPPEIPQVVVPRYSALPRTTSMEVNTSSGESTDKESDNVSLVDSLEDPSSPRVDINQNTKYDDRPVRGDLSPLLPDNSGSKLNKTAKASVFFIPIESNVETEVKSVADHLPEKVRERLSKRQLKREQKLRQAKDKIISPKSDSNYVSASDNGNQLHCAVDNAKYINSASSVLPDINLNKSKRKNKPLLPSIESIRKSKTGSKGNTKHSEVEKIKDKRCSKPIKRKNISRPQDSHIETSASEKKQAHWTSKSRHKMLDRLTPLTATKDEYVYDILPKRIYHKTELNNSNKRIEILEIVECIQAIPDNNTHRVSKSKKSKIPVLVNSKLPSISKDDKTQRPVFLDFDQIHEVEPKIDQLIANILIDALNKTELQNMPEEKQRFPTNTSLIVERRPPTTQPPSTRHQGSKYQQTFEAIPEERTTSLQSSSEDASNTENVYDVAKDSNNEKNRKTTKISQEGTTSDKRHSNAASSKTSNEASTTSKSAGPDECKGKAALGVIKDENFSTIPQGWITFYTLHKSQGSPESTSDEGKKKLMGSESTNYDGNLREDLEKLKKLDKIPEDDKSEEEKLKDAKAPEEIHSIQQNLISPEHNDYMVPSKQPNLSQDSVDTWTSSDQEKHMRVLHPLPSTGYANRNQQKKGRYRNYDNTPTNKIMPGGWTVTVSGTTSGGQFAPDLEMRLTFPRGGKQNIPASQSDSGFGEENTKGKRENFPHLVTPKKDNRTNRTAKTANSCSVQQLPHIMRHRSTKKSRCESSNLISVKDYIEPRQTRTSSRRLLLNRPRTFITPAEFIDIEADDTDLKKILERFPEILKITGNAISPERKPRVPTMSERDVTRTIYRNT